MWIVILFKRMEENYNGDYLNPSSDYYGRLYVDGLNEINVNLYGYENEYDKKERVQKFVDSVRDKYTEEITVYRRLRELVGLSYY